MSLFWKHRIVLYLKCGVNCESVMHHCVQLSKKMVVGFQPWTCWSFLWTDLAWFALYILKMSLIWVTCECAIFELSSVERWKSFVHHWVQPSKMKVVAGSKPWTAQLLFQNNRDIARIYIQQSFQLIQQSSVLYLNFGVCSNLSWTMVFNFRKKRLMWGSKSEQYNGIRESI